MWYECKVSYERQNGDVGMSKVLEIYLVDAMSFAEAEARIIRDIAPFVSAGSLEVKSIKEYKANEVFVGGGDGVYYKARINLIEECETTGQRKVKPHYVLVETCLATSPRSGIPKAIELIEYNMRDYLSDWRIVKVEETPIVGIMCEPEEEL